jgi:prepilin-type N-terminal cleavage/methylation domain-containing protein/prepilin-type processing-associated H-X9-DG protein
MRLFKHWPSYVRAQGFRNRKSTQGNGFTLIEILVVIAIIALLAAILFPVFARARENAKRASCQSNLKQIALGLIQYTQDYDERFPNWVPPEGGTPFWYVMAAPYFKSQQIFRCPSQPRTTDAFGTTYYSSYAMTGMDDGGGGPGTGNEHHMYDADGAHMSWIYKPAITYLVVESERTVYGTTAPEDGYYLVKTGGVSFGNPITSASAKSVRPEHFGGYNVAFVDGHVKWVKLGTEQGYAVSLHTCSLSVACTS